MHPAGLSKGGGGGDGRGLYSNRNQMVRGQKYLQFRSQGAGNVGNLEPLTCNFFFYYRKRQFYLFKSPLISLFDPKKHLEDGCLVKYVNMLQMDRPRK